VAALPRWVPWKGPAIPCEPRLALQPQVASESAINYDAVHSDLGFDSEHDSHAGMASVRIDSSHCCSQTTRL
jgi:hypothetical protein